MAAHRTQRSERVALAGQETSQRRLGGIRCGADMGMRTVLSTDSPFHTSAIHTTYYYTRSLHVNTGTGMNSVMYLWLRVGFMKPEFQAQF